MANKSSGIIIDIGFTSDIEKMVNDLESKFKRVNFKEIVGISDAVKKECEDAAKYISTLSEQIKKLGGGVDLTQIGAQMSKIISIANNLAQVMSTVRQSLSPEIKKQLGLDSVFDSISNSLSGLSGAAGSISDTFNDLTNNVTQDIKLMSSEIKTLEEHIGWLIDAKKQLDDPKLYGNLGRSKDKQRAFNEVIAGYKALKEAADKYNDAVANQKNADAELARYANSFERIQGALNKISDLDENWKAIRPKSLDKSFNDIFIEVNKQFDKVHQLVTDRIDEIQDLGLKNGLDFLALHTQSTRRGEEPIRVKIALASKQNQSLRNDVLEVIESVNEYAKEHPIIVEVKLASAYQSRRNQQDIKQILEQVHALEQKAADTTDAELKASVTTATDNLLVLIDRMNRQIDNAMNFTVQVVTDKAETQLKTFITNAKEDLQSLKNVAADEKSLELIENLLYIIEAISSNIREIAEPLKMFVDNSFNESIEARSKALETLATQFEAINSALDIFAQGIKKVDNKKIRENLMAMTTQAVEVLKGASDLINPMLPEEKIGEIKLTIQNKDDILREIAEISQAMAGIFSTEQIDAWENKFLEALSTIKTKCGNIFNPQADKAATNILAIMAKDAVIGDQAMRMGAAPSANGTYSRKNIAPMREDAINEAVRNYKSDLSYLIEKNKEIAETLSQLGNKTQLSVKEQNEINKLQKQHKDNYDRINKITADIITNLIKEETIPIINREHGGVITHAGQMLGFSSTDKKGSTRFTTPGYYGLTNEDVKSKVHSHAGDIIWMPSISGAGGDLETFLRDKVIPYDTTVAEREVAIINHQALTDFFTKAGFIKKNKKGEEEYRLDKFDKLLDDYVAKHDYSTDDKWAAFSAPTYNYMRDLQNKGVGVDFQRNVQMLKYRYAFERVVEDQFHSSFKDIFPTYTHEEVAKLNPLGLPELGGGNSNWLNDIIAKITGNVTGNNNDILNVISNNLQEILSILQSWNSGLSTGNANSELAQLEAKLKELDAKEAAIRGKDINSQNKEAFESKSYTPYVNAFNGNLLPEDVLKKLKTQTKRNNDQDAANKLLALNEGGVNGKAIEDALQIAINSKLPYKIKQAIINYINGIKDSIDKGAEEAVVEAETKPSAKISGMGKNTFKKYLQAHPDEMLKYGMSAGPDNVAFNGNFDRWWTKQIELSGQNQGFLTKGKNGRYVVQVDVEPKIQSQTNSTTSKAYTAEEQAELDRIAKEREEINKRISEIKAEMAKSTEQSTPALDKETEATKNIAASMEDAAKKKEAFATANEKVAKSAEKSAKQIEKEFTAVNNLIESLGKLPTKKNPILTQLENVTKNADAIKAASEAIKAGGKDALKPPKRTKEDAEKMLIANEASIRSTASDFLAKRLGILTDPAQIEAASKEAQAALDRTWSDYNIADELTKSGAMEESVAKEYAQAFVDNYISAMRSGLQVSLSGEQQAFLEPFSEMISGQTANNSKFLITEMKAMADGLVHITALVRDADGEYQKLALTYNQVGDAGSLAIEKIENDSTAAKAAISALDEVSEKVVFRLGHVDMGSEQWDQLVAKMNELGINLDEVDKITRRVERDGREYFRVFDQLGNVKTIGMSSPGFLFEEENVMPSKQQLVEEYKSVADTISKILNNAFKGDENAIPKAAQAVEQLRSIFTRLKELPEEVMSGGELEQLQTYFSGSFSRIFTDLSNLKMDKEPAEVRTALISVLNDITSLKDTAASGDFNAASSNIMAFAEALIELGQAIKQSKGNTVDQLNKLISNTAEDRNKNTSMPRRMMKEYDKLIAEMEKARDTAKDGIIPAEVFNDFKSRSVAMRAQLKELGIEGKSMGDKIGRSLKHSLISVARMYLSWYRLISYIRQGIQQVTNLDTALTKMSYTMNVTDAQLQDMSKQIVSMAKDLSSSVENISQIYQIYANLQTTQEELAKTAKPTAILANLSGVDASTAADQLQGVLNQFKLTADDAMHIVDVYDKISASIKVDYSKGIAGMADAVKNVGNFANEAGLSFEQLSAIVGRVMQQTRQEGGQIGVALKTNKIVSMYRNVHHVNISKTSKT